jgi:hypothetical protein
MNKKKNTLLPIIDKFSALRRLRSVPRLNGIKHLDYLVFKEALLIYLDKSIPKRKKELNNKKIKKYKECFNKKNYAELIILYVLLLTGFLVLLNGVA